MSTQYRIPPGHLHLSTILNQEARRPGGFLALEMELAGKLDRRKLKRIADGDRDTSLSFTELHALDEFLTRAGHGGLNRVFRSASFLEALAESPQITFFLGFQPESTESNARTWISHWDLRSVTAVLQGVYRYASASRLQTELNEVLLRKRPNPSELQGESWWSLVESQKQRQSLVAIGSPKACHASELMLATMFDTAPFDKSSNTDNLPFSFEWTTEQIQDTPSSFAWAKRSADMLPERFTSLSLMYDKQQFVVAIDNKEKWEDYGVIVAQRRPPNGSLWIICAGLSGPATLAAARVLAREHINLPPLLENAEYSKIVCRAVKAEVVRDAQPEAGDRRRITSESFIADPIEWP